MKGPSLQKTTALSAVLHLTFLVAAALVLKQSQTIIVPSPYVVNLVGPASPSQGGSAVGSVRREEPQPKTVAKEKQEKQTEKAAKDRQADQKLIEDRLSEIASKKKVERIVRLRTMLAVKGTESRDAQKTARQPGGGTSQGTLFDSYYAKITNQIRQEWIYPDAGDQNVEAIIAVKIARDGSVTVQKVEKSSGNTLFDRSALRAIAKASPVMPPPFEMEIGMRFYP